MYHSFPRRRGVETNDAKSIEIVALICEFGLLLTPEIEKWVDQKISPGKSEEYIAVSKRCCFTELAPSELSKHAQYFGDFALEFEPRVLCDIGAVPVFYIPRVSDSNGYGVGPALVTQLAHVQELLDRINNFLQLARGSPPDAPLWVFPSPGGGLTIRVPRAQTGLEVPAALIARIKMQKPNFAAPNIPADGQPFNMTTGTLLSLLNILNWNLHSPDILRGTIKALASLFYSTERMDDPLLSHYQQREWRIIGGVLKDQVAISLPMTGALKARLIALDRPFFERQLSMPTGLSSLVDECEVFAKKTTGEPIMSLVHRVIAPARAIDKVREIVRKYSSMLEVAKLESL